jgi:hypothetical protein
MEKLLLQKVLCRHAVLFLRAHHPNGTALHICESVPESLYPRLLWRFFFHGYQIRYWHKPDHEMGK